MVDECAGGRIEDIDADNARHPDGIRTMVEGGDFGNLVRDPAGMTVGPHLVEGDRAILRHCRSCEQGRHQGA